jgi:hypothetical protein
VFLIRTKHPIDLAPGDRAPRSAILAELMGGTAMVFLRHYALWRNLLFHLCLKSGYLLLELGNLALERLDRLCEVRIPVSGV